MPLPEMTRTRRFWLCCTGIQAETANQQLVSSINLKLRRQILLGSAVMVRDGKAKEEPREERSWGCRIVGIGEEQQQEGWGQVGWREGTPSVGTSDTRKKGW